MMLNNEHSNQNRKGVFTILKLSLELHPETRSKDHTENLIEE